MARRSVPSIEDLRPTGDPLTFGLPALKDETTSPESPQLTENPPEPEASPWPPSPEEPAAWASDLEWSDADADAKTSPARTSSGASSGRELLGPKKIGELARGAVIAGGDALHELLVRDEAAASVELWKADEDDAAAIGDPLARIAARHNPLGEVMGDGDTADGIEAMVGLGVYLVKQFTRWRVARSLRRSAAIAAEQAATTDEVPAEPETPAPVAAGPLGGRWPGEGADPRPLVG